MPLHTTLSRSLVAACAVAAATAPVAVAKPVDLRPAPAVRTSSLAGTSSPSWDVPRPLGDPARAAGAAPGTPLEGIGLGLAGACVVVAGFTGAGAARTRARRSRLAG